MNDVIVVGLGMMGSAALRYLSVDHDSVLGIGPTEPTNWKTHSGVFASHYDQGRITRILDDSSVWGRLAQESIARYRDLEVASGIPFYGEAGCLRISGQPEETLTAAENVGNQLGAIFERKTSAQCQAEMPWLAFGDQDDILWESQHAGHVNPRAYVAAQLTVAQQHGADLLRQTVTRVEKQSQGFSVSTDSGEEIRAQRVLIAAGAYTNRLLPDSPLKLRRRAHMVLLARVGDAEQARLRHTPSVVWRLAASSAMERIYMLPPVMYPDGHWYIKIGGRPHWAETYLDSDDEIRDWFHSDGFASEGAGLLAVLHDLLPGLQVDSSLTKPCILTFTDHGLPYIDELAPDLFVAAGGCGSAAKSSDAIGRLAALQVAGNAWPVGFDATMFVAILDG